MRSLLRIVPFPRPAASSLRSASTCSLQRQLASLLRCVAMPFVTSSFLLLVRPGAPSSVLAPKFRKTLPDNFGCDQWAKISVLPHMSARSCARAHQLEANLLPHRDPPKYSCLDVICLRTQELKVSVQRLKPLLVTAAVSEQVLKRFSATEALCPFEWN